MSDNQQQGKGDTKPRAKRTRAFQIELTPPPYARDSTDATPDALTYLAWAKTESEAINLVLEQHASVRELGLAELVGLRGTFLGDAPPPPSD